MRIPIICTLTLLFGGIAVLRSNTASIAHADAPASFEGQAETGSHVFAEYCAKCHGDTGQGTDKAPALVGLDKGALPLKAPPARKVRHEDFVTVGDVARFAMMNMPADDPGGLSDEEYLAVLAFALQANGFTLQQPLDLDLADQLTIPR
jgi:polar amino acid transport system substrate-binding protein